MLSDQAVVPGLHFHAVCPASHGEVRLTHAFFFSALGFPSQGAALPTVRRADGGKGAAHAFFGERTQESVEQCSATRTPSTFTTSPLWALSTALDPAQESRTASAAGSSRGSGRRSTVPAQPVLSSDQDPDRETVRAISRSRRQRHKAPRGRLPSLTQGV